MKKRFLIILLLLAFNANALAGVMMVSEMIFIAEETVVTNHDSDSHDHINTSIDQTTQHKKMAKQASTHCAGDIGCNICIGHCANVPILIEIADFNIQKTSSFTFINVLAEATSSYFRLLRPPKFS